MSGAMPNLSTMPDLVPIGILRVLPREGEMVVPGAD